MSKIMKAARGQTCIRCGAPDAYGCHYNGPRQHDFGKGRGIKANDLATAEFCLECDRVFTEGSMFHNLWANKWERSEDFLYWVMMTNIRRMENGVIQD